MDPAPLLLALRLGGQDHALERDRVYLLGSDAACDLRLPAAAAGRHASVCVTASGARLHDLGSGSTTTRNGMRVGDAGDALAPGDVVSFGDGIAEAIVVRDDGTALIVPLPAERAAAATRRVRERAHALRQNDAETFQQLVAGELRRAPWLALSFVLHLLALLVLWLTTPVHPPGGDARATVRFDAAGELPADANGPPQPPEVLVEAVENEPVRTEDPPAPVLEADVPVADGATPRPDDVLRDNARLGPRSSPPAGGGGRGSSTDVSGQGSGGFQRTVGELRKSGLEIVFVFDSTGSMSRTILDTKTTIAQMLAVLRALVPDARVGIVTYRDHDKREEYVVRQVPLGSDFWQASNFVQFVTAEGGGDRPEDVRAGLRTAFQQEWRSGSRRVVVLAGDAPPHASDATRLLGEVKAFVQNGRSFVHALVTSPQFAGADTHEAFRQIAAAGKGTCQGIDAREQVLRRVLTLAFGREFDQDLAAVIRTVEEQQRRVDVRALDLARRGGPELAAALRAQPVPLELWNALVRRPRRTVVGQLIDMLGANETPASTRQALAAALQRIFQLALPPIDPVEPGPPARRQLDQLRQLARNLDP